MTVINPEDIVTCVKCGLDLEAVKAMDPEMDGTWYCGKCYVEEYF